MIVWTTLGAVLDGAVVRYGTEFAELLDHCRVWINGDEAPDGVPPPWARRTRWLCSRRSAAAEWTATTSGATCAIAAQDLRSAAPSTPGWATWPARARIEGGGSERRKLGLSDRPDLGEFHVEIAVRDLAQLDGAFTEAARRHG